MMEEQQPKGCIFMDNEKTLVGLAATALGVGFVIGRRNKKAAVMKDWSRTMEIALLQQDLLNWVLHGPSKQNLTEKQWQDGINERIDFMNTISKM
jgi:hypothetical protein